MTGRAAVDRAALTAALGRVSTPIVFGLIPVAVAVAMLAAALHGPHSLFDFHGDLYAPAVAILHGRAPYHPAFLAGLAALARAGGQPTTTFAVPVYPAPALVAALPLGLLPYTAAALAFTALSLAALAGGLRLLGVRDWRCYGAALAGWPVLHSLTLGQINGFLVLGLAVLWRYRDRRWIPALAAAATITAKLFLWPVAAVLLVRHRRRTALLAAAIAVAGGLAAWAVLGFDALSAYPRMLSDLSRVEGTAGVSLPALAAAMHLPRAAGTALGAAATAALLATAYRIGVAPGRARTEGGPQATFGLVVIAALTASPLVWPHYLTLLLVPIALVSPRLGPLWLLPLLAWLAPTELTHGSVATILLYLAIELLTAVSLVARARRPSPIPRPPGAVGKVSRAPKATVRLRHGLQSTSSRSYIAAQRPNKGPEEPHYTQVEDLMPRTASRPT